ncbi:cation diffusion facilitator family transporter [Acididesulfobacillus acetoxydans]|nr:cation diffusion facilitator family transporter [Acididesulfobacillus acetoxydans]
MKKVEKTAVTAFIINSFAFAVKYGLALYSGSIALKAEALHSLTDVVASLTVFAGLKLANRKTPRFPYGLYKVENLVSALVGIMIIFAGYGIAKEVFQSAGQALKNSGWNIAGMCLVIAVIYSFSRYERKVGKETGSPGLSADSRHFLADVMSNGVVLIALLSNYFGIRLDRVAAILIVLFIVRAGGKVILDAVKVLLDISLDKDTLDRIRQTMINDPVVSQVQSLIGRSSGRYKLIEANITLNTNDLVQAHEVSERIEKEIRKKTPNIDEVFIHYEPVPKTSYRYALPVEDPGGETICAHFGEAPYFRFATIEKEEKNRKCREEVLANPVPATEQGKGILTAEWLSQCGTDAVIMRNKPSGKGPLYVFSHVGMKVLSTEEETATKALETLGICGAGPKAHLPGD